MKVGLISLGCAKNQVDSEQMLYMLREAGHQIVNDEKEAEALIVNTCGFIDSAKEESIEAILNAARMKTEGRCRRLIVTGCLAQRYGKTLMEEMPEIDGLLGVERYGSFIPFFEAVREGGRPADTARTGEMFECGRILTTQASTAYVRIGEGCANRCAFCAIPLIRGPYRSRPRDRVLGEMRALASQGVKEQILIAQDTSCYGRDTGDREGLAGLLKAAEDIPGLMWLRVLYLYAADVDRKLIDAMAENPRVCRYLDIPLQHASRRILKRMRRRGDIAAIEDTLNYAREKGFCLRTTFIVGFPGETDEDFEELEAFCRRVRFDRMGAFAYSAEEDTPAASMDGAVDGEKARERLDRLMRLQQRISLERGLTRVGQETDVMVCEREGSLLRCRSAWEAPDADGWIFVRGDAREGDVIRVRITGADIYDLQGEKL